jgi:hypothetical protein
MVGKWVDKWVFERAEKWADWMERALGQMKVSVKALE